MEGFEEEVAVGQELGALFAPGSLPEPAVVVRGGFSVLEVLVDPVDEALVFLLVGECLFGVAPESEGHHEGSVDEILFAGDGLCQLQPDGDLLAGELVCHLDKEAGVVPCGDRILDSLEELRQWLGEILVLADDGDHIRPADGHLLSGGLAHQDVLDVFAVDVVCLESCRLFDASFDFDQGAAVVPAAGQGGGCILFSGRGAGFPCGSRNPAEFVGCVDCGDQDLVDELGGDFQARDDSFAGRVVELLAVRVVDRLLFDEGFHCAALEDDDASVEEVLERDEPFAFLGDLDLAGRLVQAEDLSQPECRVPACGVFLDGREDLQPSCGDGEVGDRVDSDGVQDSCCVCASWEERLEELVVLFAEHWRVDARVEHRLQEAHLFGCELVGGLDAFEDVFASLLPLLACGFGPCLGVGRGGVQDVRQRVAGHDSRLARFGKELLQCVDVLVGRSG